MISILRDGGGFVPLADSVVEAGDEVLLVLDTGLEDKITERFTAARRRRPEPVAAARVDYLLIGGGLARPTARAGCARRAPTARSCWSGREPDPPYNRPAAVEGLPPAARSRARTCCSAPTSGGTSRTIELLTRTSVMKLDAGERVATLSSKEEVAFGKALIATGANVRRLRVDGCDLDGIHYLRAFGNSDAIRADAERGGARRADRRQLHRLRGGGVADRGARHDVLDRDARGRDARARSSARRSAASSSGVLEEHGVEVHGGDELERFEGVRRPRRAAWSPRPGSSSTATAW